MDTERAVPGADSTGDPRVDDAVAGLAALRDRPLDEHPPVLEAVHDRLREILGELGDAAGRPGEPGQQGQLGQPDRGAPRYPGAPVPRDPRR